MSEGLPDSVRIREVGPRDGFQNEPEVISTDDKVALIDCLARTGVSRLEVTSFVRPDVIPQLSDATEVLEREHRGTALHHPDHPRGREDLHGDRAAHIGEEHALDRELVGAFGAFGSHRRPGTL